MTEKQMLAMVEAAYRLGLRHAIGMDDITGYLVNSQAIAHDIYTTHKK